ncbi:hypothetical protein IL306_002614 [Fusarium sp. DS 682]|nr:hypothetical protein IL306_002614 [Fusarium sp. DS 682]
MAKDDKSEMEIDAQQTGKAAPDQQPSKKDTDSKSTHNQTDFVIHVDSPVETEPTRVQTARETEETYKDYRQARKEYDHTWWGNTHGEPARGNPDRRFMFARNPPVSDQKIQDALQAYNVSIMDPATGELNPLGPHLRPTTPPMERAEKQIKGLQDQCVEVPPELVKEMIHHFTSNNGLHQALLEWCQGKKDVPVEYFNELIKRIDRLKLEASAQLRDVTEKLDRAIQERDARLVFQDSHGNKSLHSQKNDLLRQQNQKLIEENAALKKEVERLREEKEERGDTGDDSSSK